MNWTLLGLGLYGPSCFVLGYYISHRGFKGVVSDLADVKKDVENLKAKVLPNVQAPQATPNTVTPLVLPTVVS